MKISVTMITMNEDKNIERALSSCGFADEIVVVDGGSTDRTLEILKSHDRVVLIEHPWENHFARQRQISLDHCTGDWIIRLDTDEAFSLIIEENVRQLLESAPADVAGYKIRQCNLIGNEKFYSARYDDFENLARVWRKGHGVKWERQVHEVLTGIQGKVIEWNAHVVHYGFLDRERYWRKGEYYSQLSESGISKPSELYYREYDIQPRPPGSAVGKHVPCHEIDEAPDGPARIAVIKRPGAERSEVLNFEPLKDTYSMTVYSSDKPDRADKSVTIKSVSLSSHENNPAYMIGLEHELFYTDIICTDGISLTFTYQSVIAKLKLAKKVVAVVSGSILFEHEENAVIKDMKKVNRKYVDIFAAVTECARESLILEGVPEEKIVVIPYGTDIGRFRPDRETGRMARRELGIEEDEIIVLFTGELIRERGIYTLVHAAKKCVFDRNIRDVSLRFIIAGLGPEEDNIRDRIEELGIGGRFLFIDEYPYDRMQELYNAADIFVLPVISSVTWNETFSMHLIEAMACGMAVIASDCCSVAEAVGDTGVLVQPDDHSTLADSLVRLVKDDRLRSVLGSAARARAVSTYDSQKSAIKFAALFDQLLETSFKGAVRELSEYTNLTPGDVLRRIRSVYDQQLQEWSGVVGGQLTDMSVKEFYHSTDSYLFDLVQYNYENPVYIKWVEEIGRLCAGNVGEGEPLQVLDFGGGIGSMLISLSGIKGVQLSYADIPGRTFEYAQWRFKHRNMGVEKINACKDGFLQEGMYDIIIALDVVEHLVNPEETVRYLASHIKPNGFFVVLASFFDNNGEAGWHLNVDKYTNESFYNFIKSLGMDMVSDGMPCIFLKNEELSALSTDIETSLREERFEDSRKFMESYFSLRSVDLDMLVKYAEVCLDLGDRETAVESLEKVLLFSPDLPEAIALVHKIWRMDNETAPCK